MIFINFILQLVFPQLDNFPRSFVPSVFAENWSLCRPMRSGIVLGSVVALLCLGGEAQTNPPFACVHSGQGRDAAIGLSTGSCSNRTLLLRSVLTDCGDNSVQASCLPLPGQPFSVVLAGCLTNNASLVALQEALSRHTQFNSEQRER